MKYIMLKDGHTGLKVSKLILGSIYFGTKVTHRESFYMMDTFLEQGGTMIDTARCYANWIPGGEGSSEKSIGQWLKSGGRRDRILIGTKGGTTEKGVNSYRADLSEEGLSRELDESLKCLNTDYIDLYWLHRDDPRVPVGEIVELTNRFIHMGKVRMLGVSNWQENRLLEANQYAKEHGLHPFVMNQIQFSLAECSCETWGDSTIVCMDREKEQWYEEHQIPIAAFTAQGQGFYTKLLRDGPRRLDEDTKQKFYHKVNIERAERVALLSKETGLTASQIVLGYLENNRVETAALIGSRTRQQLEDSLSAAEVVLTEAQIRYLTKGM